MLKEFRNSSSRLNLPSKFAALPHFPPCGTICAPLARKPLFSLPESSNNALWEYLSKLRWTEGGQWAGSKKKVASFEKLHKHQMKKFE